jgi:hypothetical protein
MFLAWDWGGKNLKNCISGALAFLKVDTHAGLLCECESHETFG